MVWGMYIDRNTVFKVGEDCCFICNAVGAVVRAHPEKTLIKEKSRIVRMQTVFNRRSYLC